MKILVLAPQPFFQLRGTPIAVRRLLRTLGSQGHESHLLTLAEGEDVRIRHCTIHRILRLPGIRNVPPGFSLRKLVCDVCMLFSAMQLCRKQHWDLIHAVEESVFIAWILKKLWGFPYVYDMDSSLAEQMLDRFALLRPLERVARSCERLVIKDSIGVVAVCQALERLATELVPEARVVRVEDVSLIPGDCVSTSSELPELDGPIVMYVGNLQSYQGIDLLLEAFAELSRRQTEAQLVVIGGTPAEIMRYGQRARSLGIQQRTHLLRPCQVSRLMAFLKRADVLVSPRLSGRNTPMKLFSYLDSGRPVVATRLVTHTQILHDRVACLVEPNPQAIAEGLDRLLINPALRATLAERAQRYLHEEFREEVTAGKLITFFEELERRLKRPQTDRRPALAR